jgi:branched-chain amino acid transport system substrate-binding protein
MSKKMKIMILSGLVIFLLPALTFAQGKNPIIIGNPNTFSGVMSMYGEGTAVGLEVAIEEINSRGGVLGRPLKLIKRDDRLNPEVGVREVKDLILNEKADFIIGVLSSGVALAVSEYCKSAKKILIIMAARSTKITEEKGHRYVFRYCSNFSARDSAVLEVASKIWPKNETDKVCQLNLDYEQGKNAYDDTMAKWKKINPDMKLVSALWPPLGTTDWAPYISKLMASEGNLLIHSLYGGAWLAFAKQAIPMGLYKKFHVVASCAADLETTNVLTKDSPVPQGIVTIAEWPYWALKNPEASRLAERFMKKSGKNYASPHAYGGYLAVYSLKEAIEAVKAVDTEKIINYLEGKKIETTMGSMLLRKCDHQLLWPVYAGQLGFMEGITWPVVKEPHRPQNIEATYNSCEEIEKLRKK